MVAPNPAVAGPPSDNWFDAIAAHLGKAHWAPSSQGLYRRIDEAVKSVNDANAYQGGEQPQADHLTLKASKRLLKAALYCAFVLGYRVPAT